MAVDVQLVVPIDEDTSISKTIIAITEGLVE